MGIVLCKSTQKTSTLENNVAIEVIIMTGSVLSTSKTSSPLFAPLGVL